MTGRRNLKCVQEQVKGGEGNVNFLDWHNSRRIKSVCTSFAYSQKERHQRESSSFTNFSFASPSHSHALWPTCHECVPQSWALAVNLILINFLYYKRNYFLHVLSSEFDLSQGHFAKFFFTLYWIHLSTWRKTELRA